MAGQAQAGKEANGMDPPKGHWALGRGWQLPPSVPPGQSCCSGLCPMELTGVHLAPWWLGLPVAT